MATILIVDDHSTNREFLVTLLGYSGHRLLEAADGAEALALVRAEQPDLVIADVLMPTMDGYEFVRQLRADPDLAQTIVIFYTAHYLEREAQALAQACGVSHILVKPSEPEVVLQTVEVALGLVPPAPPPPTETFDREHLRLLTDKLSQQTETLQAVNQRLAALIELGQELVLEHDRQRILEKFCHAARDIIGAKYAAVNLVEEAGQRLGHFVTSGVDAETAALIGSPPTSHGLIGQPLVAGHPLRLRNIEVAPQALGFPPHHPPMRSFLGAPIASPTRLYGVLYLTDKLGAEEFSEEDERLIAMLAAQVAVAYENGSQYAEIQSHAAKLEQEVIERKRAEEGLRDAEAKYRTLVEQLPAITYIVALGPVNRTIYISPQVESLLGFSQAEWLADPDLWSKQIHPDDRERVLAELQRRDASGEGVNLEYRLLARDGRVRWFHNQTASVRDQTGQVRYSHGVMFDITERKSLEEQLLQSQKMEAIGRLAGGVAHDFNNVLMVITGYSELLLYRRLGGDNPLRGYIEEIKKAGERAAALTGQLLAFSRKQVLQPEILDLNAVVADMDKMLRRLIGEDIDLVTTSRPGLGRVRADRGQIEQVMMNLAINARDAMPQGGKLTIETANVELDEIYTRQHLGVAPGSYVMLAVSDTGTGMDAEVQAHLFEPFFTTKEQGKGTGLGLATVYGIIKQSGGHIWPYSEPGQGTTFKVYLPWLEEAITVSESSQVSPQPLAGSETILLVEDEVGVRELIQDILATSGYTLLAASTGSEALELSQQHSAPIDLLLTDVIIPGGMNGRELAERLTSLYPAIKVLYMSGYTDDAIVHNGILKPGTAFLQKPFTPDTLARKVREILGTS